MDHFVLIAVVAIVIVLAVRRLGLVRGIVVGGFQLVGLAIVFAFASMAFVMCQHAAENYDEQTKMNSDPVYRQQKEQEKKQKAQRDIEQYERHAETFVPLMGRR